MTFCVGLVHLDWDRTGEILLALISLLDAFLLALMGYAENIYVTYVGYIAFRSTYNILLTVARYSFKQKIRKS